MMMPRFPSLSLTARSALLFAVLAALVISSVGLYLYGDMARSMRNQAAAQTANRVAYFRSLLGNAFPISLLSDNPHLFENMLGNERDILIFQRPGQTPLINVNPGRYRLPTVAPVADGVPVSLGAVHAASTPEGVPIRFVTAWVSLAGHDPIQITAGHIMLNETRMLAQYRDRIIAAVIGAFLLIALLGYGVMRHGLKPLRRMAAQAEGIHPATLTTRLSEQGAPAELHQVIRSFNAMLDRLADGYQRLSRFSADLAHEIRTPVNALMGHCQVALYQRRSAQEYESVLVRNSEELERISRMVENILFLARAGEAQSAISPVPLPLEVELQRIADYFEGLAEERGLALRCRGEGMVQADAMLLRRALSNLVDNAIRYADADSDIILSGRRDGDGWLIEVINHGPPIPPDHMDKLFDRFYRADDARTSSGNASGLGLSIVQAIMKLHRGSAGVSCTPAGEICFHLYFPDNINDAQAAA
ncbi:heavy metal sensor histidine kinase [Sodalis ligni]|jgi:two-component system heavy metal sensor histidine kinase CusS|uniref:Sensor protein n=1 Tax=Sodalis ligni TaxID=2697027 RepID=A0A4R1NG34_9GAMM|nr:heavy metal sensor histidine kinase [Sodalis ligni]TCL03100.1 two-component system heavy metal sensor histidine kinase CusS [Sodalis ligni]